MSADGSTTMEWGDKEYRFCLRINELRELQDTCGCSLFLVLERLRTGKPMLEDITETLRLGLIGGGMEPLRAKSKVAKFVSPPNIAPHMVYALAVLVGGMFPPADDDVGKKEAATDTTPMNDLNSASSSEPLRQWDGPSNKPSEQAFGNSPPPSMAGTSATAELKPNGPIP